MWSGRQDSNLRPSVPKTDALPGCATPRVRRSSKTQLRERQKEKRLDGQINREAHDPRLTTYAKAGGPGGTRTPDLAVMSGQL